MKGANVTYTNCNIGKKQISRVVPLYDIHIGSATFNEKLLHEAIDFIKDNRYTYWFGGGDYTDFGTRNSPGMSLFEQKLSNQDQLEYLRDLFYPIRKKCLGLLEGNHDKRSGKAIGISTVKWLSDYLDTEYLGDACYHVLELNDNKVWKIFATHGRSGATTVRGKETAIKRLKENHEDADIYCMGHVHRLAHLQEYKHAIGLDLELNKMVLKRYKIGDFVFCGHFMNYVDSYAQEANYKPEPAGFPIFIFRPDGSFECELNYGDMETIDSKIVQEKY